MNLNIVESSVQVERTWVTARRWHKVTTLLGSLTWAVGTVALLLAGDTWGPGTGLLTDDLKSPSSRSDVRPAKLALTQSKGWPRQRQAEVEDSFAVRWRGPGAMIAGVAWFDSSGLIWRPTSRWQFKGARDLLIRYEMWESIQVSPFSTRSFGVVLTLADQSVVWFAFRRGSLEEFATSAKDWYDKREVPENDV